MTTSPNHRNSQRSNRKSVRYLAGTALVSGGIVVGAIFSPVGIAGAQTIDDSTTESVEEAPAAEGTENEERQGRRGQRGNRLANLVEASGLTIEEIQAGSEAGQTLAETAEANGVDVDALTDDLVATATERINEAVANERLTQEEADAKITELDAKITELLNRTPEERQEAREERQEARQERRASRGDGEAPADGETKDGESQGRQERRGSRHGGEAPANEGETVESSLTT